MRNDLVRCVRAIYFVRYIFFEVSCPGRPDVLSLSLPLQFVLVESMRRFDVIPDDASATAVATALTGEYVADDIDDGNVDVPTIRGETEPLFDEPVPLEPRPDVKPDDDG
jgi:hypothetical protein